tara:strand:- start:1458 stop:1811 length:354 start_codon:yes stop_codon:yes gene_type:complete
MKGENYLYFCDTTDEPNNADEAILIPASTVLGVSIGAADGTVDNDALYLSAQGFVGDGDSRAAVVLAVTAGKLKEAMDDVASAISGTVGNGFTVIADVKNGVFCSDHITGCTVDSAV